MTPLHFKKTEELINYLKENNLTSTYYFVTPDYVDGIIGLADDGRLVYSYELMVESLYQEYMLDGDIDDPYTDAISWIEYNALNTKPAKWHIVFDVPDFAYDEIFDIDGLEEILTPYEKYTLGSDEDTNLVLDSEMPDDARKLIEAKFEGTETKVIYL